MILISDLKLPCTFNFDGLKLFISEYLNLKETDIKSVTLRRKAVDARKKSDVHFCCSVIAELGIDEKEFLDSHSFKNISLYSPKVYTFPSYEHYNIKTRPVIIGFGPAGIFAGLTLARAGLKPIILERGYDVDTRQKDIEHFQATGELNPASNIQFGEGGAGTFSDGKLTTGIKDLRCNAVLEEFVSHGAESNILYDAKPHIGTDVLRTVMKSLRKEIINLGGEIHFGAKMCDLIIKDGNLSAIRYEESERTEELPCENAILSIGHSARDTFYILKRVGAEMERKPFAVGARIEHKQHSINAAQLGAFSKYSSLTPADYKLSEHLESGRGVYTFCMCPGGEVVNASSEESGVTTNGMSNSKRDGINANSALLVSVEPSDFEGDDVLAGIEFQRKIERAAYNFTSSYKPIAQTVGDFLSGKPSKCAAGVKPSIKGGVAFGSIEECLPDFVCQSMKEGIKLFDRRLHGFADKNALLIAPETRSSSPVRILRNKEFISNIKGIFPCGEGAGYAGGIMSAAVDGIKCAEALIERIKNNV